MPHPSHLVLQHVQVQHTQPLLAVSAGSNTVAILTAQVGSSPAAGRRCNCVRAGEPAHPTICPPLCCAGHSVGTCQGRRQEHPGHAGSVPGVGA